MTSPLFSMRKVTEVKVYIGTVNKKEIGKLQYNFNIKTGIAHEYELHYVGNNKYDVFANADLSKLNTRVVNAARDN